VKDDFEKAFDQFAEKDTLPGWFGVAHSVMGSMRAGHPDQNLLVKVVSVVLDTALAVRRKQLKEEKERVGVISGDPRESYLKHRKAQRLHHMALLNNDITLPTILSTLTVQRRQFAEERDQILCFSVGPYNYLCQATRDIDNWFYVCEDGDKDLALKALAKHVADCFWRTAPHGACIGGKVGSEMHGNDIFRLYAEDLRLKLFVMDPDNGQQPQLVERVVAFHRKGVSRNIMLRGLPGTGKSMFARNIYSELAKDMSEVRALRINSATLQGKSAGWITDIVSWLSPDVVILDDIDRLSLNASVLLDFLEDVNEGSRTRITIMSINREDTLDTALYRPGRVDEEYVMQLPSAAYRRLLITSYQEEETVLTSEEVETLVAETDGFTPAELSELMKSINVLGYKGAAHELTRIRQHRALYMKKALPKANTAHGNDGEE
jgi:hypothetical protein